MRHWPWEYLFKPFNGFSFPDLYLQLTVASLVALIATVIFYNIRTRQLHRHSVYLQMYEWVLWTGVITFGLMLVYFVFQFDWIIVLATLVVGLSALVWIRFVRFPPYFRAYERQLAKQFGRDHLARLAARRRHDEQLLVHAEVREEVDRRAVFRPDRPVDVDRLALADHHA